MLAEWELWWYGGCLLAGLLVLIFMEWQDVRVSRILKEGRDD